MSQPFVKWAGGKRRLLPQILSAMPPLPPGSTYFEPFLGGGAVFFALSPERAVLSDTNSELIEAFEAVRDDVVAVTAHLRRMKYDKDFYYRVRRSKPRTPQGRAARLIYLNKTCFNGLYRVNLNGDFNVPFGRHANVEICDASQLHLASKALKRTTLRSCDFEQTILDARPGDVVYFDPPYTTAHITNGFIEYNARVFAWEDQHRLAGVATELVRSGVHVVVSNAYHQAILDLYPRSLGFSLSKLDRWSTMAGSSERRFATAEAVLVGVPDRGALRR